MKSKDDLAQLFKTIRETRALAYEEAIEIIESSDTAEEAIARLREIAAVCRRQNEG